MRRNPSRGLAMAFAAFVAALALTSISMPAGATVGDGGQARLGAAVQVLPGDVDDFDFDSFDAQYHLSRADDGTSQMGVTETIVARFPSYDQNRGIVRTIPTRYNDVSTDPNVTSVTDGTGASIPYTVDHDGGLKLSLGGDDYVHGVQTYVITYTVSNVIRSLGDGKPQELYWNVNGVGWSQIFKAVTATVTLDNELLDAFSGDVACYYGSHGSTSTCTHDGDASRGFTFSKSSIGTGQTLTLAVGFAPGTFVVQESTRWAWWASWLPLGASVVALGGVVGLAISRRRRWHDEPGRGTIVPEYVPPGGVDLLLAGNVAKRMSTAVPAVLLSLAVRGHVRVNAKGRDGSKFSVTYVGAPDSGGAADGRDEVPYALPDDGASGWPAQQPTPEIPARMSVAEVELIVALFGVMPVAGQTVSLDGPDSARGSAVSSLTSRQGARALQLGLRKRAHGNLGAAPTRVVAAGFVVAIASSVAGFVTSGATTPVSVAAVFVSVVTVALTIVLYARPRVLTRYGKLLAEYLDGNAMYIDWAEEDRLAFLQGAVTAERIGPEQKVALYERMLPVAVLLGKEKTWAKALAEAFADVASQPEWFVGAPGVRFTPALFASQVSSMTASARASVSSPSSSGGSGSGGGGFAGGGGGGGGGGGR